MKIKPMILLILFSVILSQSVGVAEAKTKLKVTNVTRYKKSLTEGKSFTLKSNRKSSKLTFKSSSKKIATVSKKGKIKAIGAGNATITVTKKNTKEKVKVKVTVSAKSSSSTKVLEDGTVITSSATTSEESFGGMSEDEKGDWIKDNLIN